MITPGAPKAPTITEETEPQQAPAQISALCVPGFGYELLLGRRDEWVERHIWFCNFKSLVGAQSLCLGAL